MQPMIGNIPTPPDVDSWYQWVLGVWIAISTGVFAHIYGRIDKVRENADKDVTKGLEKLWFELSELRKSIESDRERAADSRAALAASIVTREEMERQITRLVETVDKQIRTISQHAR